MKNTRWDTDRMPPRHLYADAARKRLPSPRTPANADVQAARGSLATHSLLVVALGILGASAQGSLQAMLVALAAAIGIAVAGVGATLQKRATRMPWLKALRSPRLALSLFILIVYAAVALFALLRS